jgi:DNA replication protein DnaC
MRMDLVILDQFGYLPFSQAGGALLFNLLSRLYEHTSVVITINSLNGPACLVMPRGPRRYWVD